MMALLAVPCSKFCKDNCFYNKGSSVWIVFGITDIEVSYDGEYLGHFNSHRNSYNLLTKQ
jgi:hypothetical protein